MHFQRAGLAAFDIDPDTGKIGLGPRDQNVVLAEIASCQMEYKYLTHLTGNRNYSPASDKTMDWKMSDDHLTIGALADSAYEYLLKQYLLSGKKEKGLRDMYIYSIMSVIKGLFFISPKRKILYVTDVFSYSYSPTPTLAYPIGTRQLAPIAKNICHALSRHISSPVILHIT
ncbi:glycoside hydrolase family 47 [Pyrrhoderma noxium]|uniref:mannosyl-oligosaccharide 1,2-alpha-mannosidase n=1 Tax=Pyrrhoderma noxium TaxID=2282107 RepID=A0A286UHS3_9AGAM|nr:glycoside hydrolase family 47 [Pyrrhoderma noxium]